MLMPGRLYSPDKYNYGFNGKLKDDETYNNTGTEYDYGFRIYNPRLGRFLSVDPLTQKYAYLTPYQFASNTPIRAVDIDGAEGAVKKYDFDFPTGGGGGEILLEELEDGAILRIKSPAQNSVQEGGGGGPARYAPPPSSAPKINPPYEVQEYVPVTQKPIPTVQTGPPPPVTGSGPNMSVKNLSKQDEIDVANLQGKRARGDALTSIELARLRALEAQQTSAAATGSKTALPGYLDYSYVSGIKETRFEHINLHGKDNLAKPKHGIFYQNPIDATNAAWRQRGNIKPIPSGKRDMYVIPYPNAGKGGGNTGSGQNLDYITIFTQKGTNIIVTSYPSDKTGK